MGFEFPLTLAKEVSGTVRCPSRHIPAKLAAGARRVLMTRGVLYPSASEVQLYDSSLKQF